MEAINEKVINLSENNEIKLSKLMMDLFANRTDVYATAYCKGERMAYSKQESTITEEIIQKHIKGKITAGFYQLQQDKVKWACLDFDENTKEDYENAQTSFIELKKQGLKPLFEMSGGGEYKCHIWIFSDCPAKDIYYYLIDLTEKIGIKPHEIFPKQLEASESLPYGNLVKLPLAYHLISKRKSHFLDDSFVPIKSEEDIIKRLEFHLNNKDIIPKAIIKEKPNVEYKPIENNNPNEFDDFFNYVLNNELPSGKTATNKQYQKIVGVNDNILKNLAIWFYQKGYTIKILEKEFKPIYDKNGWAFSDLKGWFNKALKGDINHINVGELIQWCKTYNEDLIKLIPKTKLYREIKLSELNASLINNYVTINCQITGEQTQKAIPREIEITCETCKDVRCFDSLDNPSHFIADRDSKTIIRELKDSFMCSCVHAEVEEGEDKPKPHKVAKIKSYIDFSILYVRDLLDRESLTAVKRYDAKKIYVVNQTLPNAKTINIKGKVFIEPKTKNLSIVCDSINILENQVEDFKITEQFIENSKKYFQSNIDIFKQINPDIVGTAREIAKKALVLQLHSPCRIFDITRKKLIRGGLNTIFYGDTKTAKSEISKDVTQKGSMPLAEYTICETGGRTGFLYTIDKDKGSLIWGSLALNDMGLVILDGLQSMHSEELGEFREAIEQQEIIVRRSLSGEALARTRIVGCLNPNKAMVNYIYKCQGLQDTYVFSKSPEFTRWDLFIPFCQKDVSSKELSHRKPEEKPIPEDIFIQHIYWAWSRKPEQIIYTESAVTKINDKSESFIDTYSLENLPVVHNGIRDIITRLSVAMACQMHSTDETHEKVIVESEHVEKSVTWYEEVLKMLELSNYKQDIEGKSELTDNECIAIAKDLGKMEWDILEAIKLEGKSSTQLSEALEVETKTIKRHYELLIQHNLIETRTGKGITLSLRGIKFVRWGMLNPRDLGTKDVPKKISGDKKSPHVTRENIPLDNYSMEKKQTEKDEIDFSEMEEEIENE